jgi:hypothetical protein
MEASMAKSRSHKKVWHMSPSPSKSLPGLCIVAGRTACDRWPCLYLLGSCRRRWLVAQSTDSNPFLFSSCVFFCILWNLLLGRSIQRSVSGSHITISCFCVPG